MPAESPPSPSVPETVHAEALIRAAENEENLSVRQMRLLEAEIVIEEEQLRFLRGLERITASLERHSRWLVYLTVALLAEALADALLLSQLR